MGQAVPWLPPASAGAVERLLVTLADSWAAEWIAAPACCRLSSAGIPRDIDWHGAGEAAVGVDAGQMTALGQAIAAGAGDEENARDREILVKLAEAAIADLAAVLMRATGSVEGAPPRTPLPDGAVYLLAGTHSWSAYISLGPQAEVRLRKHGAGKVRHPVVGRFSQAFASEEVRLGCHLGQATLLAADVTALTPGDLIVFDRGTAEALPVTVEGAMAATGKATIVAEAGGLVARIREAPTLAAGTN